jgi:NADPH2:quinone reductase
MVHTPGGPEALIYEDAPAPPVGPGDILVRAAAFGVGHPDVLIRTGVYKWMPPLPANPGNDAVGVVEAVGAEVCDVKIGQHVLISARDLPRRGGCYAELIAVPAHCVHLLDKSISFEAAACLSNYQAAYALLHDTAGPRKPRSVVIVGGAGGVGSALIQLAKHAGMRVLATVSTSEKAEFAKAMGADDIIYYRKEPVSERILQLTDGRGVDLILDHAAGPDFVTYLRALDKWGTLVSYNGFTPLPQENLLGEMRKVMGHCPAVRSFSFHIYDNDAEGRRRLMRAVIDLLRQQAIKPAIAARFPLSQVRKAHEMLDAGTSLGKIIMTP